MMPKKGKSWFVSKVQELIRKAGLKGECRHLSLMNNATSTAKLNDKLRTQNSIDVAASSSKRQSNKKNSNQQGSK